MNEETPLRPDQEAGSSPPEDSMVEEVSEQISQEPELNQEIERPKDEKKPGRFKRFFKAWLGNPKGRWATFFVLLIAGLAIGFNPDGRYWVLNQLGVRSSLSIKITDRASLQPLEGVKVELRDRSTRTNKDGMAKFSELKHGRATLTIRKLGFAKEEFPVVIGWGSNPQDDVALSPTGLSYVFQAKDFFSGKGIPGAQATSGEFTARADEDGEIILTIANPADTVGVKIEASGYQTRQLKIQTDDKDERTIKLKPVGRHVFISNRTGSYDLYSIEADGSEEELLVKAHASAGLSNTSLLPHPSRNAAAMVTNSGNFSISANQVLYVINLQNGKVEEVVNSPNIRLVGWHGDRVAYIYEDDTVEPTSTARHKLRSFDYKSKTESHVAEANSINDAVVVNGRLYYAPSAQNQNGINVSLFAATMDGSSSDIILAKHVLRLIRLSYDGLTIQVNDEEGSSTEGIWYGYNTQKQKDPKKRQAPPTTRSRIYVDAPDGVRSAYVDQRDGQGALIIENTNTGKERVLLKKEGIAAPMKWLNNTTLVYHLDTDEETADYVVSINGGQPRKITNVTSVGTNTN